MNFLRLGLLLDGRFISLAKNVKFNGGLQITDEDPTDNHV